MSQLDREAQPLVGEGRGHPDIDHRDVGQRATDRVAERLWVPNGVDDIEASAGQQLREPVAQDCRILGDRDLGISRNILANRLDHLVAHDVLERRPYQEHPLRYDYVLTEKGRELWLVLAAMRQWGDKWLSPNGPPVVAEHRGCGHVGSFVAVCEHCGEQLERSDLVMREGPGGLPGQAPLPLEPARQQA
jgi:hypothetical protein